MSNGNCRDNCPSYTFYYTDYSSNTPIIKSPSIGATEGTDLLQFSVDSTSCLQLPGPHRE